MSLRHLLLAGHIVAVAAQLVGIRYHDDDAHDNDDDESDVATSVK